jgi:hypothetical protein
MKYLYSRRFIRFVEQDKIMPDWFVFAAWRQSILTVNITGYESNEPLLKKFLGE